MSGPEISPIKFTENEDCKYSENITHEFKFKNEVAKCEIPVYDDKHPEIFLKLVNEYWNMAKTYEMFTGDQALLFDRFKICLKEWARAE